MAATWRETQKARLRERIYSVSLQLLREHGFDGTSIERIAQEVGIGKGTFFNHFESKEHVVEEWHRRLSAECMAETEKRRFRTAKSAIQAWADISTTRAIAQSDLVTLKARIAPRSRRLIGTEQDLDQTVERFFVRHIELGRQRGELRDDLDDAFFAQLIIATLTGTVREWVFSGLAFDFKKRVRDRIAFLFRAAVP